MTLPPKLYHSELIPDPGPIYIYGAGLAGIALCDEIEKRVGPRFKGLVDSFKTGSAGGYPLMSSSALKAVASKDTIVLIACEDVEGVCITLGPDTPFQVFDAVELSRNFAATQVMMRQLLVANITPPPALLPAPEPFPDNRCAPAILSALESGVEGAFRFLLATLKDAHHWRLADHVHAGRVIRSLLKRIDPASLPQDIREGLTEHADALTCLETQPIEYYSLVFLGYDLRAGRPFHYFRPDGLMSIAEKHILRQLVSEVARPGMIVCELGSFAGRGSTRLFAELVRELGGRLICVDPLTDNWQGNSLWNTFQISVRVLGIESVIETCRMSSTEAADTYPDGHFDMVFIDGDHGYDMVMSDIRQWRNKVRPGGYLCGHDVIGHERDLPAEMISPYRTNLRQSQDGFPILHAGQGCQLQPGVVAAVCDSFGDDFQCGGHPNGIWWHRVT